MADSQPVRIIASTNDRVIVTAAFANLSAQSLYAYLTQPEKITRWWPETATADARPGGDFVYQWQGGAMTLRGTFTVAEPGRIVSFTWQWDHEPGLPVRDVTAFISAEGEGSHLTLLHGFYGETESEQKDRQGHIDGWQFFLGRLMEH